ncbi:MAG: hypothetical protein P4M14_12980 [Gammaproteobacteria bacterium]|nr:hypothetical protein [Gammaproteobacteria bacterium]
MSRLIAEAPFIRGIEYLTLTTAELIWQQLTETLQEEVKAFNGDVTAYLSAYHAAWNTVGRVCFHLAENKNNSEYPFALHAQFAVVLRKLTHLSKHYL